RGADRPVALELFEPRAEHRQILRGRWVDDVDAVQIEPVFLSRRADFLYIAEKDRRPEFQPHVARRRFQHARLRAFRKYDPLWMPLQFLENRFDEFHKGAL